MSSQSPAWKEMNRSHRPSQGCVSKPFSREKQVIVMRLPLHTPPSGRKMTQNMCPVQPSPLVLKARA